MRLLIDQGNSYTKYALVNGGVLSVSQKFVTNKNASVEDICAFLSSLLQDDEKNQIVLCSVLPELINNWISASAKLNLSMKIITGESPTKLINKYRTRDTLGADRLMAAVAAEAQVGSPAIILSLGTATVADAISADGCFLGGLIAPGIESCLYSLQKSTALWQVSWQPPTSAIGTDSTAAMRNGIFYHTIGGIQAMLAALYSELGENTPLVITGGWAEIIAPHLPKIQLYDPQLVLRGMGISSGWLAEPIKTI